MKTKLVNFNAPKELVSNFDKICNRRNLPRTSALIFLIENFINEDREKNLVQQKFAHEEEDFISPIFPSEISYDEF